MKPERKFQEFEDWWTENVHRLERMQCTHLVDLDGLEAVAREAWEGGANAQAWRSAWAKADEQ
jgi:hypothetical protein